MGVSQRILDYARQCIRDVQELDASVLDSMYRYTRLYMTVGGMPAAVKTFIETKNIGSVVTVHRTILRSYMDDIRQYADTNQVMTVEKCLESVPHQLAKENKRFHYTDIDEESTYDKGSRYYGYALEWLRRANLVLECDNLTELRMPLSERKLIDAFKLYFLDTGLLLSYYEDSVRYEMLTGDMHANNGAIFENLIANMLHAQERTLLFYQKSEKGLPRMELDFITTVNWRIAAIEAKSGENRVSRSLNRALKDFDIDGIMLETRNIFIDDKGVRHYPVFAAAFMECIDTRQTPDADIPNADDLDKRVSML